MKSVRNVTKKRLVVYKRKRMNLPNRRVNKLFAGKLKNESVNGKKQKRIKDAERGPGVQSLILNLKR